MSFHRANATWESPDGTWNIGFYTVIEPDYEDRDADWDPEWDVDYDEASFEDVYSGTTQDAAWDEVDADRPNPGGSMVYRLPANAEAIAEFEAMAADLRARRAAAQEATANDEPAVTAEAERDTMVTASGSAHRGRHLEQVAFDAIAPGDLLLNSPDGTAGEDEEYEIIAVGDDGLSWRVVESQLPPLPEGWVHFAHEVGYSGEFRFIRLYRLA